MGRKMGGAFFFYIYIFIFSTHLAGCCCSVLAKKSALSCTADTPVTQRALSIFSPPALSCLFVGDEELTVGGSGGGWTKMQEGLRMKRGQARELSKFSSQPLTEHGAPGTRVQVARPSLPRQLLRTDSRHSLSKRPSIRWWGEPSWSPETWNGFSRTNRQKQSARFCKTKR